ncbi:hypothetical protein [Adhaeretor mobilis]|uniref:Uncharacterized protein n=1 Tax=Adhaeretor mobilis TaxID=1930276 RepID=A0A517N020_9BACT|nr:hypothetical protein [Adhaeretor mobilis]QDT00487.1 hypothetical protein HG15A2_38250 [Adhaeretor mobilis]
MSVTIATNVVLFGPPSQRETVGVCIIASAIALLLLYGTRRAAGTTLAAPLLWGALSASVLGLVELTLYSLEGISPLGQSALRYLAAAGTFCPLMAVLGAKRPQDRGWQWIVLSLWVVLAIPAIQSLLTGAGSQLELPGIWKGFLGILIVMGLLNYLPTRHWMAALPFACGQCLLLAEYLAPGRLSGKPLEGGLQPTTWSYLLILAAAVIVWLQSLKERSLQIEEVPQAEMLAAQLRRWLKFRDGWGAFWTARLMARVNQTAEIQNWPVRLWPSGFKAVDESQPVEVTEELAASIKKTLDALLWRFERVEEVPRASDVID